MIKKKATPLVIGFLALFVLMQIVPAGRTNPPVKASVAWDSPRTEELVRRACYDCHSNETTWPWYSYVAPVSWLIVKHVNEGRGHMNLSLPDPRHVDEGAEEVEEGEMPLPMYLPLHPEAKLTEEEKQALINGWIKTFPEDAANSHGDHEH